MAIVIGFCRTRSITILVTSPYGVLNRTSLCDQFMGTTLKHWWAKSLAFDGDSTVPFRRISGLSCVAIRKGTDTISELFRMREGYKRLCLGENRKLVPKKATNFWAQNGDQHVQKMEPFFFEKIKK